MEKIRLIHLDLERYTQYGTGRDMLGVFYNVVSNPFELPMGMTMEEACKVVSFLSEKIENENSIEPASAKSVKKVAKSLESWGFKKVENNAKHHATWHTTEVFSKKINLLIDKLDGVTDLFTVGGMDLFKNSNMYEYYFNWFTEGVSNKEIAAIYNNVYKAAKENLEKCEKVSSKLGNERTK